MRVKRRAALRKEGCFFAGGLHLPQGGKGHGVKVLVKANNPASPVEQDALYKRTGNTIFKKPDMLKILRQHRCGSLDFKGDDPATGILDTYVAGSGVLSPKSLCQGAFSGLTGSPDENRLNILKIPGNDLLGWLPLTSIHYSTVPLVKSEIV
jgi:hypothetical protein